MIAFGATLTYCLFVWFLCNLFGTLAVEPGGGWFATGTMLVKPLTLPLPLNAIHWQLIAVLSLAYASTSDRVEKIVQHYGVLLLLSLLHLVGISAAMLDTGSVI